MTNINVNSLSIDSNHLLSVLEYALDQAVTSEIDILDLDNAVQIAHLSNYVKQLKEIIFNESASPQLHVGSVFEDSNENVLTVTFENGIYGLYDDEYGEQLDYTFESLSDIPEVFKDNNNPIINIR